jgi:hypothetical protein
MKKIIIIMAIIAMGVADATAQVMNVNIMQSGFQPTNLTPYTAAWVKKSTADTLSNRDTTYLFFPSNNTWDLQLKYKTVKVSGYVRTVATLYGISDTTGTGAGTAIWNTITGETSQCSGCSSTTYTATNADGGTTWILPANRMNFYRLRIINDTAVAGTSTPTAKVYFRK